MTFHQPPSAKRRATGRRAAGERHENGGPTARCARGRARGWIVAALAIACMGADHRYFAIQVVDEATGRGVSMVELETVHHERHYTDSQGIAAFHSPSLMNTRVFFFVKSHGYELPKDGFGFAGRALDVAPGGSAVLKIKRINIAERLYRVTGGDTYADSLLVGRAAPIAHPLGSALVLGSDSVINAVYRGKLHWFWGDTNRAAYPLGNFHVPGATSRLPTDGGLDPEIGVDLDYFIGEKGLAKETARMPGEGPTWIAALAVLPTSEGDEAMLASYVKVRAPMTIYAHGLAEFDDDRSEFVHRQTFPEGRPIYPEGHPFRFQEGGVDYLYFATPYPLVRVPARAEAFADLHAYEAFTCIGDGGAAESPTLDRDDRGRLRYAWRREAPRWTPQLETKLLAEQKITDDERLLTLRDVESGKAVAAHGGSVSWNAWRNRWIMIALEVGGTSFLGEVWYAEADTPLGPWIYARKVVTHDRYSFYNPKQHPQFDKEGGRVIFFEGTYAATFSGNDTATPRYDYNQIMYKLDLAEPRLALPVAVYRLDADGARFGTRQDAKVEPGRRLAFFAWDRPARGSVAIVRDASQRGRLRVVAIERAGAAVAPRQDESCATFCPALDNRPAEEKAAETVFYALPLDAPAGPMTTLLYEHAARDGRRFTYSTREAMMRDGRESIGTAVCRVWKAAGHVFAGRE